MKKKLTGPILLIGNTNEQPNIEYITGFRAPDPVVLLIDGRSRFMVVPALEKGRAEKETDGVEVLTAAALRLPRNRRGRMSSWATALLKSRGLKKITVPADFPVAAAERIRAAGIRLNVAGGDLFPQRAVKLPGEIGMIRQAQQTAVIAMRAAVSMISRSRITHGDYLKYKGRRLTSEAVRKTIVQTMVEHDCFSPDTIVAGGIKSADPHVKGSGPLRAHEPIVIDIFPRHMEHGYWGDLSRTVCRGRAPDRLRKMYRAVKAAQAAALSAIRPGIQCSTVHKAAADVLESRGFMTDRTHGRPEGFIHSTGHGVGLAIHEAPSIYINKDRLKKGNVITVEPGLYYNDIGGVRIEDTVAVTASGWKYLVPCEKKLEI